MSTIVANGIGDIEGKIRAAGYHCGIEHLEILIFGKMLAEVAVVSRPAIEVLRELLATHFEFIKDVFCFVLYEIKIGIITVTRHKIAVAFIPLGEFDTEIFCGDKFGIEHDPILWIFIALIEKIDRFENLLAIADIFRIVRGNFDT